MDFIRNKFKTEHQEFLTYADQYNEQVNSVVGPIFEDFKETVKFDFTVSFGKLLMQIMGNTVNGSKTSVPNSSLSADQLKDTFHKWGSGYLQSHVAGKRFGFYLTNKAHRKNVISLNDDSLWFWLTSEHVDQIKNKAKRLAAKDFLQFRETVRLNFPILSPIEIQIAPTQLMYKQIKSISESDSYSDGGGWKPVEKIVIKIITDNIPVTATAVVIGGIGWNPLTFNSALDLTKSMQGARDVGVLPCETPTIDMAVIGHAERRGSFPGIEKSIINQLFINPSRLIYPFRKDPTLKDDEIKLNPNINSSRTLNLQSLQQIKLAPSQFDQILLRDDVQERLKNITDFWKTTYADFEKLHMKHLDKIMANGHF